MAEYRNAKKIVPVTPKATPAKAVANRRLMKRIHILKKMDES